MIYSIAFRWPVRVLADSETEAFQKLRGVIDKSFFSVAEVSQAILDEEAAFAEKVGPLLEE